MKTAFSINGKMGLILVPENDLERSLLAKLSEQETVQIKAHKKLQILDEEVMDVVLITKQNQ